MKGKKKKKNSLPRKFIAAYFFNFARSIKKELKFISLDYILSYDELYYYETLRIETHRNNPISWSSVNVSEHVSNRR